MRGVLLCLMTLWPTHPAVADSRDYDPRSPAWNGLLELVQLADEVKVPLVVTDHLQLEEVEAGSAVLLVAPRSVLPRRGLTRFMRGGGRVGLLDDQGSGEGLLRAFRIRRVVAAIDEKTPIFRDNPNLPIALPGSEHPLTYGVSALVTNHPHVLVHDHLEPVLTIGPKGQALALSGAVGPGRLVAIADASIVINNMLALEGNRRFAQNLLRYLSGERHAQVFLAIGEAAIVSMEGEPLTGNPITRLRQRLQQLTDHPLPPVVVLSATWIIALGLLLTAATALPRPRALNRVAPSTPVAESRRTGRPKHKGATTDWAAATRDYLREWRAALQRELALRSAPSRGDVATALQHRGVEPRLIRDIEQLWQRLERHGESGRLSSRRFRILVGAGQSILRNLAGNKP